jgi:hypothetical protein
MARGLVLAPALQTGALSAVRAFATEPRPTPIDELIGAAFSTPTVLV